jgi:hypothetical protein
MADRAQALLEVLECVPCWCGLSHASSTEYFPHRLEVNHHPRAQAVLNLTIQEELGDGGTCANSPFSCECSTGRKRWDRGLRRSLIVGRKGKLSHASE